MTRLIAKELKEKGIRYEYLHGGVPAAKRKDLVDNFNNLPDSRVFLSTDAGSTGLNLQAAATVINIDLPWNPAVLEQRIGRIYRLGQRNSIQVINLVTPHSIEEQMLGKLRFKTSLFEGVLDDGEDSVFVGGNKFEKIMEAVSEFVDEEHSSAGETSTIEQETTDNPMSPQDETAEQEKEETDNTVISTDDTEEEKRTPEDTQAEGLYEDDDRESAQRTPQPKDLVAQGVSFLSGLAETLKSPEATAQLVDSIVERDERTGRTSIKIPVESKETVSNLLSILGKLLSNK